MKLKRINENLKLLTSAIKLIAIKITLKKL